MALQLIPPRVAFVEGDGRLSAEAIKFFNGLFMRVGGENGLSSDDLAVLAQFSSVVPNVVEYSPADASPDLTAIITEMAKTIDDIKTELARLSDQGASVAELSKDAGELEFQIAIIPDYGAALAEANKTLRSLGTMAKQNADNVAITGGAIDGTVIGGSTPTVGTFTDVAAQSVSSSGAILGETLQAGTGFGCNGKAPQSAYSLGAAATDLATVITLANNIRTMSINNGTGS